MSTLTNWLRSLTFACRQLQLRTPDELLREFKTICEAPTPESSEDEGSSPSPKPLTPLTPVTPKKRRVPSSSSSSSVFSSVESESDSDSQRSSSKKIKKKNKNSSTKTSTPKRSRTSSQSRFQSTPVESPRKVKKPDASLAIEAEDAEMRKRLSNKLFTRFQTPAIRVTHLLPPPEASGLRLLNEAFLAKLKDDMSLHHETGLTGMPLAVNMVLKEGVQSSRFDLDKYNEDPDSSPFVGYVYGGNHTRAAKKDLFQQYPDIEFFATHPAHVYLDLTDDEAILIGSGHQEMTQNFHSFSSREQILFFHTQWGRELNTHPDTDQKDLWSNFRHKMAVRYGTKDKKGNYNANAISPLLQIAQHSGVIWDKISQIFEMADNYQLKGQKAPSGKRGSLPHSRLTLLTGKTQDAPSTAAVNRSALSAATGGNLSVEDKCQLLDMVIEGKLMVKELDNASFNKKAFNTMVDYLLQKVYPSIHSREEFDWSKAQLEYPELTQHKLQTYIPSFTRTVGRRNKVHFPESFERFVKGLINQRHRSRSLLENEEQQSPDCHIFNKEFALAEKTKWRARGIVFLGSVMSLTELRIQKRDYQLAILDAPYGWGMGDWDVVRFPFLFSLMFSDLSSAMEPG